MTSNKLFVAVLALSSLFFSAQSDAKRLSDELQEIRNKEHNFCDITFYCATTKSVSITATKTEVRQNEKFMFALKGGALVVPKKPSVLGDGTLNYRLTEGSCDKDTGQLKDWYSSGKSFRADMLEGKWVEYDNGTMFVIDASYKNTRNPVQIWYASCENFDE